MDIRTTGGPATAAEAAAVDSVLGEPRSLWEGGERRPSDDHVGWVSRGALEYACRRLDVPPAEAYGVASFYSRFALRDRGDLAVHVCDDIACRCAGAGELCRALEDSLGPEGTTWHRSPCLGLCDRAPAALFERFGTSHEERQVAPVTARHVEAALRGGAWPEATAEPGARVAGKLLRRAGVVDPESIDSYVEHGGFKALRRAIEMGPEAVIREVSDARLMGRGGAAFPTGRKWDSVAKMAVYPHYLVCNADESEPGTFKDRVLMEGDPFAVVEAMTIAGLAGGCEKGFLYVRAEYPRARHRIEGAVAQARARGLLGADVAGSGIAFDIEVRRGAGAYICGEETALFNSIEGKRGEPRNKPPFPVQSGLFGKPTLVNNVETLMNVLDIVLEGGAAFAATGTAESTGTRLFCVSGTVRAPGLYEVPMGT